jgi:hypothetical protein
VVIFTKPLFYIHFISNAHFLASVSLKIIRKDSGRAVLPALRGGSFLFSSPALLDFFFSNGKERRKNKNDDL